MANEMRTFIYVVNGSKEIADRLNKIFKPTEGDHEANAVSILNAMLGTNYSYKNKKGWNKELDWPTQEIWDQYIGPKWMYCDYDHDNDPINSLIVLRSAWSLPTKFLEKLAKELYEIKDDCYIKGTYEDESYDPIGAFLYAKGFEDIEDYDNEIDFDKMWDDDDYRDEIWKEVKQLMTDMEDRYLEDKKENPENYE